MYNFFSKTDLIGCSILEAQNRMKFLLLTIFIFFLSFNVYKTEENKLEFNIIKVMNGEWNLDKRIYSIETLKEISFVNSTMSMKDGVHEGSSVGKYMELNKDTILKQEVHM